MTVQPVQNSGGGPVVVGVVFLLSSLYLEQTKRRADE